jgi:hypothetical protein
MFMKKVMAVLFVTVLFASLSAWALATYSDNSPAPKECKTCVYKAVGD